MNDIKFFITTLFIFITLGISAQNEDEYVYGDTPKNKQEQPKGFSWDKVTIGGNIGATFGDITYFEIAPVVGYYFTPNIIGGVGGNYIYYNDKFSSFSTNIYGGRVYGQYLFNDLPLLGHVEAEIINVENFNQGRVNIYNYYVGGGLKQSIGGGSYLFIMILYNLNDVQQNYYVQSNPIFRFGFAFGL